jgi:hypothetical protein
MIVRIGFVPLGDQFVAGFADVFAVDDRAVEDTWDIQAIGKRRVGMEGKRL